MISSKISNGKIIVFDTKRPSPKKEEVLLKVEYCGICGTDYQKYLNFQNVIEWGHEIIARIVFSNGALSKKLYAVRSSFPCGNCINCRNSEHSKCNQWHRIDFNGFSEYIVVHKKCIIDLQTELLDPVYTLLEPLYVANNLIKKMGAVENHDSFAVLGNGTIALLVAFLLKQKGYEVFIFARNHSQIRENFIAEIGAKFLTWEQLPETLKLCNKIINTTPYHTLNEIISYAAPHSVIGFNGISSPVNVELDLRMWHFKNLTIVPSFPHPQSIFSEELEILSGNKSLLLKMITGIFSINELSVALELLQNDRSEHIKILIRG